RMDRFAKSPAVFDTDKLNWMSNHFMKKTDTERITELCIPHLQKAGRLPEVLDEQTVRFVQALVELYQEQLSYAAEIVELTAVFFQEEPEIDSEGAAVLSGEQVPAVLKAFLAQ